MDPGDVLRVEYLFPDRENPGTHKTATKKWLVIVRCSPDESDVTFLISSSLRPDHGAIRRFEVLVGTADGAGFTQDTLIDCRWPNTLPAKWFEKAEDMGKLSDGTMVEVGKALVYGLRLHEIARRGRA